MRPFTPMNAGSPFLDREIVAENDLAFAIRDGFPISRGHTLVCTKRVVATWIDATPDEQIAVMALVNEVIERLSLDGAEDSCPDGFNIGINVGPAAGQTVAHVHVHVIPRFVGDCVDPRGGVRHCIPGKSGRY